MSISNPAPSVGDVGDAVSAQANEATDDFDEDEDEVEDTPKAAGDDSETIEPNTYDVKPSLQDK